jgi:formylglycine-generating enzyme required for sulfatase activity
MVWIPGGSFLMGSNDFYSEEQPVHQVMVVGFWMDEHPVTNFEFRQFVEATGHVTVAERSPDPSQYPGIDPAVLVPGSLVFQKPPQRLSLRDPRAWWAYIPGACWKYPQGPGINVSLRDDHPVTHVAYGDAAAYAAWARKLLPTEAEWEFAARGGLSQAIFVWGNESAPGGRMMANTWQGEFPWQNLAAGGYEGTSPVGSFPPNGYGLHDMAGNVWEWTTSFFKPQHLRGHVKPCCMPRATPVNSLEDNDEIQPLGREIPRRVVKGGSYLCAPNYCFRYRPAARQAEAVDTSACHIGFRCIVRSKKKPAGTA